MIKRLFVDNYKCLVNFELPLQELSLLLGPSGVGKTSVLDIVHAIRQLLSGDARVTDRDVFPTRTLTRWQSRDLQVFEIEVLLLSETYRYRLEVEHEVEKRTVRIRSERLEVDGNSLFEFVLSEVHLGCRPLPAGACSSATIRIAGSPRVQAILRTGESPLWLEYSPDRPISALPASSITWAGYWCAVSTPRIC